MSKVGVVIDTGACIPEELIKEYGIEAVPVCTVLEDKVYQDIVDLKTPADLFQLIDKADKFPTTSAPSPASYLDAYRRLNQKVDGILCITISSKLSMCFNSANQAGETAKKEMPGTDIRVFDSMATVGATGFMALAAARAAASGGDIARTVGAAKEVQSKINLMFVMGTLSYLAKSGRIGRAAAWAGAALNIKPIIEIPTASGIVVPVTRARGKSKAINQLLEIAKQRVGTETPLRVMVHHTSSPEEAEKFKQMVSDQFNCVELLLCEFNSVAALITGPGVLGLSFYSDTA